MVLKFRDVIKVRRLPFSLDIGLGIGRRTAPENCRLGGPPLRAVAGQDCRGRAA